jgi:pilus assembly protein Flp/PilA
MLVKLYAWALDKSRQDAGATAVEYGIMVAAIAVAILAIVFLLGDEIAALFNEVLTALQGA